MSDLEDKYLKFVTLVKDLPKLHVACAQCVNQTSHHISPDKVPDLAEWLKASAALLTDEQIRLWDAWNSVPRTEIPDTGIRDIASDRVLALLVENRESPELIEKLSYPWQRMQAMIVVVEAMSPLAQEAFTSLAPNWEGTSEELLEACHDSTVLATPRVKVPRKGPNHSTPTRS
jgi:hypothetical protein